MKDLALPTMSFPITKSHFLAGLQCSKRLWLSICKPEYASPPGLAQQQQVQRGLAIGLVARQSFPAGVLVTGNLHNALEMTQALLEAKTDCILEGAFIYDDILVRPDVIRKLPNDNWEIIEVRSAPQVQEEHIPDLTLQWYVLEGFGLEVDKASLMSVNPRVEDWQDMGQSLNTTDVTTAVKNWQEQLPYFLAQFRGLLTQPEPPSVPVGEHCYKPYVCQFKDHCWQKIPALSVFTIPQLNADKLNVLLAANILGLQDIPPHFPLSTSQREFIECMLGGEPWVDGEKIGHALSHLVWPLHFLSFETLHCAIPPFAGLHPYEACSFQYSCCTLEEPRTWNQQSYLHLTATDPRQPWLESLRAKLGSRGSVVIYNEFLEKSVLEQLIQCFPLQGESLVSLLGRCWDLQWIFKEAYQHPGFQGSVNLKDILPILVPSYQNERGALLGGQEASALWQNMVQCTDPQEKTYLQNRLERSSLLKALGMMELYQVLRNVL